MLILLHGENLAASRNYLDRFKKSPNYEIIEGKTLSFEQLQPFLEPTLLAGKKTVILENPKEESLTKFTDKANLDLIVWYGKKLEKINLAQIQWRMVEFKNLESKTLYRFLDSFFAKGGKQALFYFHRLKNEQVPFEVIVGSLNRQAVNLLHYKDKSLSFSAYQQKKLASISDKWSVLGLKDMIKKLLEVDFCVKSGRLEPEIALNRFLFNTFLT